MLGENCVIPYCSAVELTFTIKKIYEENGKWMLDIEGLERKETPNKSLFLYNH